MSLSSSSLEISRTLLQSANQYIWPTPDNLLKKYNISLKDMTDYSDKPCILLHLVSYICNTSIFLLVLSNRYEEWELTLCEPRLPLIQKIRKFCNNLKDCKERCINLETTLFLRGKQTKYPKHITTCKNLHGSSWVSLKTLASWRTAPSSISRKEKYSLWERSPELIQGTHEFSKHN